MVTFAPKTPEFARTCSGVPKISSSLEDCHALETHRAVHPSWPSWSWAAASPTAQDKTAKDPKREADRLAIDKLTKDMIQAFDQRDAAAIAANWTEDGEFIRNDGEPIRGRAEIQKGYAEFFKTLKGKPKAGDPIGRPPLSVRGHGRQPKPRCG